MTPPEQIRIEDYTYELPPDRIAYRPEHQRSGSRLLRCVVPDRRISHHSFSDLADLIPEGSILLLNDTRVMPARMEFCRESGGRVELFLLSPRYPSTDPAVTLASTDPVEWECLARGSKRLRVGEVLTVRSGGEEGNAGGPSAEIVQKNEGDIVVRFTWDPNRGETFAEVIERIGHIPLPPYIARPESESDREDYQTVYARTPGAVAAPTAGLHFTDDLLEQLECKGVMVERVTLHVGAGTFAPVKASSPDDHTMHVERFEVTRATIELLSDALRPDRTSPLVHVGTTTLRTLESLFWIGLKNLEEGEVTDLSQVQSLTQWYARDRHHSPIPVPDPNDVFGRLAERMREVRLDRIVGETALMILPGYRFMTCDRLITNFHQPGSTLILLVAAFLGEGQWRNLYREALRQGYRFLSYGDASLLERR